MDHSTNDVVKHGSQQSVEDTKALTEHLQLMEQEGLKNLSSEGSCWLGTEFSLVDLT